MHPLLKFSEAAAIPDDRTTPPVSPGRSAAPAYFGDQAMRGSRILIAEDDPVSSQIISAWLQKWGYDPVVASDGSEAMMVMRSKDAPVLAILDWIMPGIDGLEVCRRLRVVNKVVYIIFLTIRGEKERVFEALEAGADAYLVKPIDPLEFQGHLHAGLRIIALERELTDRVAELAATVKELNHAKALLLPL
jgi:DNA-binding response OmpR family regulator